VLRPFACQYLTRADCPEAYNAIHGNDPATVLIRGGSCIIDPLGTVLVRPSFDGETIRVAELDRRIIARSKYDLDVVGHYARPDIFKLRVDTRPKNAVAFTDHPSFIGQGGGDIDAVAERSEASVIADSTRLQHHGARLAAGDAHGAHVSCVGAK
jgi:nitrilase